MTTEKQNEINFEHYKSEIEKFNYNIKLARDGKIKSCFSLETCKDCIFSPEISGEETCLSAYIKWGLAEYKEPKPAYKITAFECEFLKQAYDRGCTDIEISESGGMIMLVQAARDSEIIEPIGNDILNLFSNFDKRRYNIKEILGNYEIVEEKEEENENN